MTDDQQKALDALMAVECKQDAKGCKDGPWCEARRSIAEAFEISTPASESEES